MNKGTYNAFVCHVSKLDGGLAERLKRGLQKLGKRPFQRQSLRVCVDREDITAGRLQSQINERLLRSQFLIVLVRPQLATRPWCVDEIRLWLREKGPNRILLVQTDGSDLRYNTAAKTLEFLDAAEQFPPAFHGTFNTEPSWIDLRNCDTPEAWMVQLVKIASPIHGVDADQLFSREQVAQRTLLRLRNFALILLTILGIGLAYKWTQAVAQSKASEQRGMVARAMLELESDPVVALTSLAAAVDADPDHIQPELESALTAGLHRARLVRRYEAPTGSFGAVRGLAITSDGERLLVASDNDGIILGPDGYPVSAVLRKLGAPLNANAICVTGKPEQFAIAYGNRIHGKLESAGVLFLDRDGHMIADVPLTNEPLCILSEREAGTVVIGDDSGHLIRIGTDGSPVLLKTQGFTPINAVLDGIDGPIPVPGRTARGSAGMALIQASMTQAGASTVPQPMPDNVICAASLESRVIVLGGQSGAIQRLNFDYDQDGWRIDPDVSYNGHVGPVWALLSVGSALFSAGDDRHILIWRESGRYLIPPLTGHKAAVTALAWNEQRHELISGSTAGEVFCWTLPEISLGVFYEVSVAAWQSNHFVISGTVTHSAPRGSVHVPVAKDAQTLAIAGNIWYATFQSDPYTNSRLETGTIGKELVQTIPLPGDAPVSILPLTSDSVIVGGGYPEGLFREKSVDVALMNMERSATIPEPHTNRCGLYLIRGASVERYTTTGHTDSITALAVNSQSSPITFASGGADGSVKLWGPNLEQDDHQLLTGFEPSESVITSLHFSTSGKSLFTAVSFGKEDLQKSYLLAFDLATGQVAWRVDLGKGMVVAMDTLDDGGLVFQIDCSPNTRRVESPISTLYAINADGRGLRILADGLLKRIRAFGVDSKSWIHALDEDDREHLIPARTLDVIAVLQSRYLPISAQIQADAEECFADQAASAGDTVEEGKHIAAALKANPKSISLRFRNAKALFQSGHISTAKDEFDCVIQAWPKLMLPRYMRGKTLMELKQYLEAEADFSLALKFGAEFCQPARRLDSPEAIMTLMKNIAMIGEKVALSFHLELLELRGTSRAAQGKWKESLADLTAAIDGGLRTSRAFDLRSRVYQALGDNAKAEADKKISQSLNEKGKPQAR